MLSEKLKLLANGLLVPRSMAIDEAVNTSLMLKLSLSRRSPSFSIFSRGNSYPRESEVSFS